MDCETCLVRGDHGSKYRVDVNAPGRQAILGFRSADIIVAPPISWKSQMFRIVSGHTGESGQDLRER